MRSPAGTCAVPSCGRPEKVRGFCAAHYQRVHKFGDPQADKPLRQHGATVEQRFWAKVDKSGTCWVWTAAIVKATGYGRFGLNGAVESAHRVAYELAKGPIPAGMQIDHLCRNRACVRPDHLEVVTHAENIRRGESRAVSMARAGKSTHCRNGHPYDSANTGTYPNGLRRCKACSRAAARRAYHKGKRL